MRDEKDPGTLEMSLPRKRGRPPKHASGPMDPAARAREYRFRRKFCVDPVDTMSDASLFDSLRWYLRRPGSDPDRQSGLDMYIEELVKRHHSGHEDIYRLRKK
ncbi:hypothetical protein [Xanthomonas massiliensis]|uniref:hypothetical protein n=1 Tax=Xanthomonas massiliensis TaxID=1720302 RepID=UPI00136522AD|nr:hypothetical protein [Xanthomonas massiliensis]